MPNLTPLAFIDSGIGGIPYLAHLQLQLPNASLVYVADNKYFPYGKKSADEVRTAALEMTGRLLARYDPRIIVVACNTASMHALDTLRSRFPYEFVGVVPAVKPAALVSKSRVIGVMATERALKGAYFDKLVAEHGKDCEVVRFAATELIRAIETDPFMLNKAGYRHLLGEIRSHFLSHGVDTIVLGCTHFLHLNQEMLDVFGKDFTILDSREGVTRQILHLLENKQQLSAYQHADPENRQAIFHLTAQVPSPSMYERVAEVFGLNFGGEI